MSKFDEQYLELTDDEKANANDQEETEIETLRIENERLRRELEEAKIKTI